MADTFGGFLLQLIGALFLLVMLGSLLESHTEKQDIIRRAMANKLGNYYIINKAPVFKFNIEMVAEK